MARFSFNVPLALAFLGLAACGKAPAPAPSQVTNAAAPHGDLNRIVDRYWDEHVRPGVSISPQFLADSLGLERRFLAEVLAVPRAPLDADAGLTYDIFKRQRELNIEGLVFPAELLPIQSGVGNAANAVMAGLEDGLFEGLTAYTEVLQDGMLKLIRSRKMALASASA